MADFFRRHIWWTIGGTALVSLIVGVGIGQVDTEDDSVGEVVAAAPSTTRATAESPEADPTSVTSSASPTTAETPATTASTTTAAPASTTAPSTTAAPTSTAPTTTAPPAEPLVFAGEGDDVVILDAVVTDALVVEATHQGAANFIVTLLDENGERADGLVNTIGDYAGEIPVNLSGRDDFSLIEVQADGPWGLTFSPVVDFLANRQAGTGAGDSYEGTGDRVFLFRPEGVRVVDFTCEACEANVILSAWGDRREGLVNEIGAYTGRFAVPGDTVLIEVRTSSSRGADPSWTWTVAE